MTSDAIVAAVASQQAQGIENDRVATLVNRLLKKKAIA